MKMRKLISLIASVAVISSAFVSTTAFAGSGATVPTMEVSVDKVTDWTNYSDYASINWSQYGIDTYSVKFKVTGLDYGTESYASGRVTKYKGSSIMAATAGFSIVPTEGATYDYDWTYKLVNSLAAANSAVEETYSAAHFEGSSALYPAPETALKITKDDYSTVLFEYLVTVDANYPVTLTLDACDVQIGTFNTDTSGACDDGVYYKTTTDTLTLAQNSVTIPPVEGGDDDTYSFSVADVEADASGNYAGTAVAKDEKTIGVVWDGCNMTGFDTVNNSYWAIFNADEQEKDARKTLIKGLVPEAPSVTFDAVMWFSGDAKENVTLRIDEVPNAE